MFSSIRKTAQNQIKLNMEEYLSIPTSCSEIIPPNVKQIGGLYLGAIETAENETKLK